MRQHHPKHIIERFAGILSVIYPNVYSKELPEDLYEMVMGITSYINDEDDSKEGLLKSLRTHEGIRDYNKFILDILTAIHSKVKNNGYNFHIPNNSFNKNKVNQSDTAYMAGVRLTESGEYKDAQISIPEITHDLIEISWDLHNSGNKVFRLSERLTNELSHTEISKISSEFLNLPYQTICIHIPYNDTISTRGGILRWVYIGEYFEDGVFKVFKMMFVDTEGLPNTIEFEFNEGDIFPQIKSQCKDKFNSNLAVLENISLMQFIASIILYLNSRELHTINILPLAQSPISEKTRSKYPVCVLGMDIELNPHKSSISIKSNSDTRNEINILKWMVRGHFRNQPSGIGRSERKIVWIRPYMKGRERDNDELPAKPANYVIK